MEPLVKNMKFKNLRCFSSKVRVLFFEMFKGERYSEIAEWTARSAGMFPLNQVPKIERNNK